MSWFGGFTGGVRPGSRWWRGRSCRRWACSSAAAPAHDARATRSGESGASSSATTTAIRRRCPGAWPSRRGFRRLSRRVHPTQLYETACAVRADRRAAWRCRKRGLGTAQYSAPTCSAPAHPVPVELVRVNVVVFAGMTTAQLFSVALVVAGAVLMVGRARGARCSAPQSKPGTARLRPGRRRYGVSGRGPGEPLTRNPRYFVDVTGASGDTESCCFSWSSSC